MKLTEYTVGFLFRHDLQSVVLVRKNKPEWQKGLLNGVGGHVEEGESHLECMVREFGEETGATVAAYQWEKFAVMQGTGWAITFFYAVSDEICETPEGGEEIIDVKLTHGTVVHEKTIPNIQWLLPLALDCVKNPAGPTHVNIKYA